MLPVRSLIWKYVLSYLLSMKFHYFKFKPPKDSKSAHEQVQYDSPVVEKFVYNLQQTTARMHVCQKTPTPPFFLET